MEPVWLGDRYVRIFIDDESFVISLAGDLEVVEPALDIDAEAAMTAFTGQPSYSWLWVASGLRTINRREPLTTERLRWFATVLRARDVTNLRIDSESAWLLSQSPDPLMRRRIASSPAEPSVLAELAADRDPSVRRAVATNPSTPPETLRTLAPDPSMGETIARNPNAPFDVLHSLLLSGDERAVVAAADAIGIDRLESIVGAMNADRRLDIARSTTAQPLADALALSADVDVRVAVAARGTCSRTAATALSADADIRVQRALALHLIDAHQLARWLYHPDPPTRLCVFHHYLARARTGDLTATLLIAPILARLDDVQSWRAHWLDDVDGTATTMGAPQKVRALDPRTARADLVHLSQAGRAVRAKVARNPMLPEEQLRILAGDPIATVRRAVAEAPWAPADVLAGLATPEVPAPDVRRAAETTVGLQRIVLDATRTRPGGSTREQVAEGLAGSSGPGPLFADARDLADATQSLRSESDQDPLIARATDPSTPLRELRDLAVCPDERVRRALLERPSHMAAPRIGPPREQSPRPADAPAAKGPGVLKNRVIGKLGVTGGTPAPIVGYALWALIVTLAIGGARYEGTFRAVGVLAISAWLIGPIVRALVHTRRTEGSWEAEAVAAGRARFRSSTSTAVRGFAFWPSSPQPDTTRARPSGAAGELLDAAALMSVALLPLLLFLATWEGNRGTSKPAVALLLPCTVALLGWALAPRVVVVRERLRRRGEP